MHLPLHKKPRRGRHSSLARRGTERSELLEATPHATSRRGRTESRQRIVRQVQPTADSAGASGRNRAVEQRIAMQSLDDVQLAGMAAHRDPLGSGTRSRVPTMGVAASIVRRPAQAGMSSAGQFVWRDAASHDSAVKLGRATPHQPPLPYLAAPPLRSQNAPIPAGMGDRVLIEHADQAVGATGVFIVAGAGTHCLRDRDRRRPWRRRTAIRVRPDSPLHPGPTPGRGRGRCRRRRKRA
jgi:hypothetical protein